MIFEEMQLKGAYIIEIGPIEDERGFFARSFCSKEFAEHGLNPHMAQCNISYNQKKGHSEACIIRLPLMRKPN